MNSEQTNNEQPDSNPHQSSGDSSELFQAELVPEQSGIEPASPDSGAGWTSYLSWFAILLIVVGIFGWNVVGPLFEDKETEATKTNMMQVNVAAKSVLGQRVLFPDQPAPALPDQSGSVEQRIGMILIENEIKGAATALKSLERLDKIIAEENYTPTENQTRLRTIAGDLLSDYREEEWGAKSLSGDDREFFVGQLGWVGQLGLAPKESPNVAERQELTSHSSKKMIMMFSLCGVGGLSAFLGLAGFIFATVMISRRRLQSSFVNQSQRAPIYLETFAIWMVLFIAMNFGIAYLAQFVKLEGKFTGSAITLSIFFGSLVVLIWPVFRGISFSEVRKDIGWKLKNPFVEIGAGIATYLAMLPILGFALIIASILMFVSTNMQSESPLAPTGGAIHPIQDQIATGDFTIWLGVFLTACVAAPIVEETMFRGVLYRHLRDSTSRKVLWSSVLFSCLVNGLIFALIHPQGIIGIPLLTTLAVGMSLAREWRSSLVASMTMHAINNAAVTCLMFTIF